MSDEVTADELAQALNAVTESSPWPADWPYIDERVIDGQLQPVVEWLCQHYKITSREVRIA